MFDEGHFLISSCRCINSMVYENKLTCRKQARGIQEGWLQLAQVYYHLHLYNLLIVQPEMVLENLSETTFQSRVYGKEE